jgi:hypothetical protein
MPAPSRRDRLVIANLSLRLSDHEILSLQGFVGLLVDTRPLADGQEDSVVLIGFPQDPGKDTRILAFLPTEKAGAAALDGVVLALSQGAAVVDLRKCTRPATALELVSLSANGQTVDVTQQHPETKQPAHAANDLPPDTPL